MEPQKEFEEQPIFVRIDEYKDMLDILALIRERLSKASALLQQLSKVKHEEEIEISEWTRSLGDLDKRLSDIDRLLYKSQRIR